MSAKALESVLPPLPSVAAARARLGERPSTQAAGAE
jgi:hypothetical protein